MRIQRRKPWRTPVWTGCSTGVLAHGGAITGEHGIGLAKAKWFRKAVGEGAYHLHELVKSALDPKNLLNPGKMGLP